mgnify:CR=1 FL=1
MRDSIDEARTAAYLAASAARSEAIRSLGKYDRTSEAHRKAASDAELAAANAYGAADADYREARANLAAQVQA